MRPLRRVRKGERAGKVSEQLAMYSRDCRSVEPESRALHPGLPCDPPCRGRAARRAGKKNDEDAARSCAGTHQCNVELFVGEPW